MNSVRYSLRLPLSALLLMAPVSRAQQTVEKPPAAGDGKTALPPQPTESYGWHRAIPDLSRFELADPEKLRQQELAEQRSRLTDQRTSQ